ncbi:MAG: hypothetical protein WDN01_03690 [Rhizomicrobium sp.]
MRFVAIVAVALLLSGCTWVRQELSPPPVAPAPSAPAVPAPKPEPVRPPKPKPHVERPAPQQSQSEPQTAPPAPPPPVDYDARCHALAANRADDARQLGASPADQAKMQSDTYRDCMAQSVQ